MQDQAMLTIILPTFNKKDYIAQTLESIFMQKTIYSYQVIIADDASSDGTLDIVREYNLKYPNAIQILESNKIQVIVALESKMLLSYVLRNKTLCSI
ncbi:MAG: glycosyltransferase family A protein [Helicobacter sp.]|uniref:glycosyltransferase family 2 protein n=1 Tax=Helicobacter sp. TaxID=218 RepID=UPI002A90D0AD|nr:glycosyltransferase family A protein [Helicobacter sp.]MDY5949961.1 glycosyltransferase family A protein [Helicobacter sp.]